MSTASSPVDIEYPESDGKPMGETDIHIEWLIRLRDILKYRYRDQQVYVGTDLLLYYEEGNPRKFVVPDVFVVKGCDPGQRRVFKLWEEGLPPHAVIEITSLGSRREDTVTKPKTYSRIGVAEYFVYDPTSDYLDPPLRGFRLAGKKFRPIEPEADGSLVSVEMDVTMRLAGEDLVLFDRTTGARLLRQWEAEQQARDSAEAEVERLRERLRQSGQDI